MIAQILTGCPVLRAQIGHHHIHAALPHITLAFIRRGDLTVLLAGSIHDLIAGSLDQNLTAFLLRKCPRLLDILVQRQGGGIVHDGGITGEVRIQQLCIQIILRMVQVKQQIHIVKGL